MKRLLIIITLSLIIFMTGCTNSKDPPPPENNIDPLILATIENFLKYSSQSDWDRALNLLSGEALDNARKNVKTLRNEIELVDSNIEVQAYDDKSKYALARADVKFRINGLVERRFYDFELVKLSGTWRIINQKSISPVVAGVLIEAEPSNKVIQTVKSFITLSVAGKWAEANRYLSDQTQRAAYGNLQEVRTGLSAEQLEIKPIGCYGGIWIIEANFEVGGKCITAIMKVIDAGDVEQPRIYEVTLASLGEGENIK